MFWSWFFFYYLIFLLRRWFFLNNSMVCHFRFIFIDFMFDDVNCNWAHVIINKGHASLLISRYKERTTSTITISVMLTCHTITSINGSKNIAWQFSWLRFSQSWSFFLWSLFWKNNFWLNLLFLRLRFCLRLFLFFFSFFRRRF